MLSSLRRTVARNALRAFSTEAPAATTAATSGDAAPQVEKKKIEYVQTTPEEAQRVVIANLPLQTTWMDVKEAIRKSIGLDGVEHIYVDGEARRAIVQFADHDHAKKCKEFIHEKTLNDRVLFTSFSRFNPAPTTERGPIKTDVPVVHSVIMTNLPEDISAFSLRGHCSRYGEVRHVQIITTTKNTKKAVIRFAEEKSVKATIEDMHKYVCLLTNVRPLSLLLRYSLIPTPLSLPNAS